MYIMYASASNNSLLTLTLVRTWYEESTPLIAMIGEIDYKFWIEGGRK